MGRKIKYSVEEERLKAKRLIRKKYREANKDKVKDQMNAWYLENKEHKSEYYQQNKKPLTDKQKEDRKKYMKDYLKGYGAVVKQRRKDDPLFRLKHNTRTLVYYALKRNGYSKTSKTQYILGCSFEEFKNHIESQWESWMSWDNYGKYNGEERYGWDIDHIVPTSSGINENNIIALNHYSNLQPLCSYINRDVKRDKMDF